MVTMMFRKPRVSSSFQRVALLRLLLLKQTVLLAGFFSLCLISLQVYGFQFRKASNTIAARRLTPSTNAVIGGKFQHQRKHSFLSMAKNWDSSDPFQILDIDEPTSDKKVIKRAYKRMALRYHPDVTTNTDSSAAEKKAASDRFAKINWAYSVLTGKQQDDGYRAGTPSGTGSSAGAASSAGGTGGWTPPHRRKGPAASYSSSTRSQDYTASTDWRDYMPKYDDDQYDADGDSFGKIFSDLFAGAAAGAAGLGGGPNIVKDFIDFLEGNVDGFGSSSDNIADDDDLNRVLRTANVEEVGNEMDDTELVVQQLHSKLDNISQDILMVQAELDTTYRYVEKMKMEEKLAELQARKTVAEGYAKKAQKRLLALQSRYKELITRGENDSYAAGGKNGGWDRIRDEGASTQTRKSAGVSTGGGGTYSPHATASGGRGTARPTSDSTRQKGGEDDWMYEGFGRPSSSSARGRRSNRTSSRRGTTSRQTWANGQQSRSSYSNPSSGASSSDNNTRGGSNPGASSQTEHQSTKQTQYGSTEETPDQTRTATSQQRHNASASSIDGGSNRIVPPHRRATSYSDPMGNDKRRLRELIVEDEFEKLKKDLGL